MLHQTMELVKKLKKIKLRTNTKSDRERSGDVYGTKTASQRQVETRSGERTDGEKERDQEQP